MNNRSDEIVLGLRRSRPSYEGSNQLVLPPVTSLAGRICFSSLDQLDLGNRFEHLQNEDGHDQQRRDEMRKERRLF